MKKFENLGRVLSNEEQRMVMGGNPPEGGGDGPACKPTASTCTYWVPGGSAHTGTCGSTTGGPMGSTVCACTWNNSSQADTSCNITA